MAVGSLRHCIDQMSMTVCVSKVEVVRNWHSLSKMSRGEGVGVLVENKARPVSAMVT